MAIAADLIRGESFAKSSRAPEASLTRERVVLVTLCLVAALTPLVFAARLFEPYIAPKEILVQAGTATAALLWLFTLRANGWILSRTRMWVPLLALASIAALSTIWSVNPGVSLERAQYLSTYILLFAVALSVLKQPDARVTLTAALTLAGAIVALYVLMQYTFGDPIFGAGELTGKWRTFGTLGNPNWTGEFLAVAALVSLCRYVHLRTQASSDSAKNLTLAALILIVLALASTLARGAWVSFLIGAAALVLVSRGVASFRLRSFFVPVAVTMAGIAVVIVLPLFTNVAAVDHLLNLKSVNGRLWISAVTWKMIRDAPLTGHGLGTFGQLFPNYQAEALSQPWAERFIPNASFTSYAHNDYLQLWAELGIFGLLAFGVLIWMVLRRGRALARDPIVLGCWAAVISILVNAAVGFPLHLPTTLMLFVVLIAAVEAAVPAGVAEIRVKRIPGRVAVVLVILVLSLFAYRSSYNRYVSDSALWQASVALDDGRWTEAEREIRTAIGHSATRPEAYAMVGSRRRHNKRWWPKRYNVQRTGN